MSKPKFNFQPTQFASTPIIQNTSTDSDVTTPITESADVTPSSILETMEDKEDKKEGFVIKIIPRKKLRANKKNCYGMREVEKLKDSILHFGLQQNLTVIYSVEEDRYIIESGHRRCQALDELIEKFGNFELQTSSQLGLLEECSTNEYDLYIKNVKTYEVGYPCKVNSILRDELDYDTIENEATLLSEARLIITNEDVRSTDPIEKAAAVARLSEIYQKLNIGKTMKEKINVLEQVASDLNISKQQVIIYKSLNNLIPEIKEEFEKKNITVKEGSEISKLNEEEQRSLLYLIQSGEKINIEQVKQLNKEKAALQKEIKEKEDLIAKLQFEAEEHAKQIEFHNNHEFDENVLESLTPSPTPEEIKVKEDLHRKEEEIKLLQHQIDTLKNKPVQIIDSNTTTLYRAELAAKMAHEALLRAQDEFITSYTAYEKMIDLSPLEVDRSIINTMAKDYDTLFKPKNHESML